MAHGDDPIAFRPDGSPIYDNAATVVVMLIGDNKGNFIIIRRNTYPGKGLLALPGGFQMRGETWEEAGAREVKEEIGVDIDPNKIYSYSSPVTDEDGYNLIFGYTIVRDFTITPSADEVQDVYIVNSRSLGDRSEWAFPQHYNVAKKFSLRIYKTS